jgi:hypothetical protein
MTGGKANRGVRMEHSRLRKPSVSQGENTRPRERVLLATAAECTPPMPNQPIPEYAETIEVPWYRIVVGVALHDRLEPLAGLAHGIVHTLTELLLNLPQLRPQAFAYRLAPFVNRPSLFFPLMCVKPRKSNVSGLPHSRAFDGGRVCLIIKAAAINRGINYGRIKVRSLDQRDLAPAVGHDFADFHTHLLRRAPESRSCPQPCDRPRMIERCGERDHAASPYPRFL